MRKNDDSFNPANALAAGWVLILIIALFTGVGVAVGALMHLELVFGLLGGFIGVVVGFIAVWQLYVTPANRADANRDYSNIKKFEDEDDWR